LKGEFKFYKDLTKLKFDFSAFEVLILYDAKLLNILDDGVLELKSKHIDRIFKIFQRLLGMNEYKEIGIGLDNIQGDCGTKDGIIWVGFKPGKGSAFYFTISLRRLYHET
jgi:light-regulated signal transduction histidine kinase (bacteriophytochrome)